MPTVNGTDMVIVNISNVLSKLRIFKALQICMYASSDLNPLAARLVASLTARQITSQIQLSINTVLLVLVIYFTFHWHIQAARFLSYTRCMTVN